MPCWSHVTFSYISCFFSFFHNWELNHVYLLFILFCSFWKHISLIWRCLEQILCTVENWIMSIYLLFHVFHLFLEAYWPQNAVTQIAISKLVFIHPCIYLFHLYTFFEGNKRYTTPRYVVFPNSLLLLFWYRMCQAQSSMGEREERRGGGNAGWLQTELTRCPKYE